MFDIFGSVKSLLKLDEICIDNNIFRLHYKATVIVLVTSSLLVTSKQYIGDPINCIVDPDIPQNVMDTYCWIHATFTIPNRASSETVGEVPHPGVIASSPNQEKKYHKYYQWVCFTLFFQAVLFYIPRYLWKIWDGGRIKMLVQDLNLPIVDPDQKEDRKKVLVDYFIEDRHGHDFYAIKFFFCEFLNLVNVVGQLFLMNFFLGGEFTTYGSDVLAMTELEQEQRTDPMSKVFPKVTKCTFHKFGPSGTVQGFDGLCVLPLNIINEKIYVFIWFWFVLLAFITGTQITYRVATCFLPNMRTTLLRARARLTKHPRQVDTICRKSTLGDWFILYQLGKNIDPLIYREFINDLYEQLLRKRDEERNEEKIF